MNIVFCTLKNFTPILLILNLGSCKLNESKSVTTKSASVEKYTADNSMRVSGLEAELKDLVISRRATESLLQQILIAGEATPTSSSIDEGFVYTLALAEDEIARDAKEAKVRELELKLAAIEERIRRVLAEIQALTGQPPQIGPVPEKESVAAELERTKKLGVNQCAAVFIFREGADHAGTYFETKINHAIVSCTVLANTCEGNHYALPTHPFMGIGVRSTRVDTGGLDFGAAKAAAAKMEACPCACVRR